MTPKGADLEATDLIEVSTIESGSYVTRSITGQELIDAIPAPTGFVPTSRTLTINGVAQDLSTDRSWTISTGLSVGTTPIASGTIGRVLFEGTGNVLQESANLFWDNTNGRLGIGTSSPAQQLHVFTSVADTGMLLDSNTNPTFTIRRSGSDRLRLTATGSIGTINGVGNGLVFQRDGSEAMRIAPATSNILINTTTDAGFRLDVNGTARVQGNATIVGTSLSSFSVSNGATAMIQTASSGIGSSDFRLRLFNNGNTQTLDLYGSGDYDHQSKHAFRTNGTERMRIFSTGNVLIGTTTDAGFRLDVNGTARVSGNLTVSSAGTSTMNTFLGGSVAIGNDWVNDGYILKIKSVNTGIAGIYSRAGGAGGYPIFWCQDANGTASTTFIVRENGSVHVGATANVPSSKLTLTSTTQGFLPPRMTTTEKNAIASPATGLQVYDTTLNRPCFYDGTTWITL